MNWKVLEANTTQLYQVFGTALNPRVVCAPRKNTSIVPAIEIYNAITGYADVKKDDEQALMGEDAQLPVSITIKAD